MIQSIRQAWRRPAFPLIVCGLVAAVVAVHVAAFGALHALRWKALPYADSDALVELRADLRSFGFKLGLTTPLLDSLQSQGEIFEGVAGFTTRSTPTVDAQGERWQLVRATLDLPQVLGVAPVVGRAFTAEDYASVAEVLLLSDRVWRSRFNADPTVLGREVRIQDQRYVIVGVMPPGFVFPEANSDAWIPLVPTADERSQDSTGNVGWLSVIARVSPGTSTQQAEAALAAVLANEPTVAGLRQVAGLRASVRSWRERLAGEQLRAVQLLGWAALAFLLVVVGTMALLAFDRAMARAREISIRRAVGASPSHLGRLISGDLLVPAVPGVLVGLLLGVLGFRYLLDRGLMPAHLPAPPALDAVSIGAGLLAAVVTVAVAWIVARAVSIRADGRLGGRVAGVGLGGARFLLLIAQVALTTALLGSSGLLIRSVANLLSVDRGFDATGVVVAAVDPIGVSLGRSYDPAKHDAETLSALDDLVAKLSSLPGVTDVARSSIAPFSEWESISSYRTVDSGEEYSARERAVSGDYFRALGAPLLAGRSFSPADSAGEGPVIVDARYVERHLSLETAVSASVWIPTDGEGNYRQAQIVGVVPTMKHERLDEPADMPTVYHPIGSPLPVSWLIARTSSDPGALALSLRAAVEKRFPDGTLLVNGPLEERVAASLRDRRALLETLALFAGLTLLLSAAGLYAVLSQLVRREIPTLGLRMALGATAGRVAAMVLRRGVILVVVGGLLGLLGGIAASAALLRPQLYELGVADAMAWSMALGLVCVVALLACAMPAWRAARIEPIAALQSN